MLSCVLGSERHTLLHRQPVFHAAICTLAIAKVGRSGARPCGHLTFRFNILSQALFTSGHTWATLSKHLQCDHLSFPRWSGLQDSFLFLEYLLLPLHTKHTQHSIVLVPHKKYLFCECGDCTCMWMYMYGGVHTCLPTCMWKPKADMTYFLDKSSPYLLRQDLSLKVELASSAD